MQEVLRNERKFLIDTVLFLQKSSELRKILHEDPHNLIHGYSIRTFYFDTEYDKDFFY